MPAALSTVIVVVIHTPIWVWALYAMLLVLGLQRTRDSIVPLWRMLILPAIVTLLALVSLAGAGAGGLPPVLAGLLAGGAAGWRLEPRDALRREPDGRLFLRGEWWSFAQLLVVLVLRYTTNVVAAVVPVLDADPAWRAATLLVSAALSGLFLGRTAARLRTRTVPPATPGDVLHPHRLR